MKRPKRVPIAGIVKSAKRHRRNFFVREAVRMQGKITGSHLLQSRRNALGFSSIKVATMQGRKHEDKNNSGQLNPQAASSSVTLPRSGIGDERNIRRTHQGQGRAKGKFREKQRF